MKAVYATPGNRTLPNSLEGCYANHYTSAAYSRQPDSKITWQNPIFQLQHPPSRFPEQVTYYMQSGNFKDCTPLQ